MDLRPADVVVWPCLWVGRGCGVGRIESTKISLSLSLFLSLSLSPSYSLIEVGMGLLLHSHVGVVGAAADPRRAGFFSGVARWARFGEIREAHRAGTRTFSKRECFNGVSKSEEAEYGTSANHVIVLKEFLSRTEVSRVMGLATLSHDEGLLGGLSTDEAGRESVRVEPEMQMHDEELFDKIIEGARRVDCMAWCNLERRFGKDCLPTHASCELEILQTDDEGSKVMQILDVLSWSPNVDPDSLVSVLIQLSSSRDYGGGNILFERASRINIPGKPPLTTRRSHGRPVQKNPTQA